MYGNSSNSSRENDDWPDLGVPYCGQINYWFEWLKTKALLGPYRPDCVSSMKPV